MNLYFIEKLRERFIAVYNRMPINQADIVHELQISRTTLHRFMHCPERTFSNKVLKKILAWVEELERNKV